MNDSMKDRSEAPQPSELERLQKLRLKEILDPTHSALLIIDMQNDFLSTTGKSEALWNQNVEPMRQIIPAIEEVTELFDKFNRPVIRTMTYEDPEERTTAGQDRFLFFEDNDIEGNVACLRGTEGAELYVPAREGDIIVEKNRISAYVGTDLDKIIKDMGIRTMFVVGVKTQRCVARTLQDLSDNAVGLHTVLLEDCVASDNQDAHEQMIQELKKFYPPVITSEVLAEDWSQREVEQPEQQ